MKRKTNKEIKRYYMDSLCWSIFYFVMSLLGMVAFFVSNEGMFGFLTLFFMLLATLFYLDAMHQETMLEMRYLSGELE